MTSKKPTVIQAAKTLLRVVKLLKTFFINSYLRYGWPLTEAGGLGSSNRRRFSTGLGLASVESARRNVSLISTPVGYCASPAAVYGSAKPRKGRSVAPGAPAG